MGKLGDDMKNLSEEVLNSFKQRLKENEELVMEVQSTLDGFRKDHKEMSDVLKSNAASLRLKLNDGEKTRLKDFDSLMSSINKDIKNINDEVLYIFKSTNDMLIKFDKDHSTMSTDLKSELGKNLADRVKYTKSLLTGFQKELAKISKENQQMANKLRKDLNNGELNRLDEYNGIMKAINLTIRGIQNEVTNLKNSVAALLGDLSQSRSQASLEWEKMQTAIANLRKTGISIGVESNDLFDTPSEFKSFFNEKKKTKKNK